MLLQCSTNASKVQKGRRSARLSIASQRHLHRLQEGRETFTLMTQHGTQITAIVNHGISAQQ
jgi:hypothetical protein